MIVNTHNLLPIMKLFYNFKNYMNSKPIMRRKSIHVKDIVMQKIRKINKNQTWRCGAGVTLENNALQGSNYDDVILLLVFNYRGDTMNLVEFFSLRDFNLSN